MTAAKETRSSEERLKRYPLAQEEEPVSGRFVTITIPTRQDPEWEAFAQDPDKWVQGMIRLHGFEINGYHGNLRASLPPLDETNAEGTIMSRLFHIEIPTRQHSHWIAVSVDIYSP